MVVMLTGLTAAAQDFNPDNPPEPMARYLLTVKANPAEAATVSGGGKYKVNSRIYPDTQAKSKDWKFVNWTKSDGAVVSTNTNFTYYTTNAAETLTANYEKVAVSKITLSTDPVDRGYLYGSGTYRVGDKVRIRCDRHSYFDFLYWSTEDGVKVSDKYYFDYQVTEKDVHFVAHLKYNPNSPGEPSETKVKHRVYFHAIPEGAGYFNYSNGTRVDEGDSINLVAYNYSNWSFQQWEKDGVKVSDVNNYKVHVGKEDVHLVARFFFNPGNPGDPSENNKAAYTLYGMQSEIYKGQTLMYPVYLENTDVVTALNFKVRLPKGFQMDTTQVKLSVARASAYQVKATAGVEDSLGIRYALNIAGGTEISGRNGILLYLPISVNETVLPKAYRIHFEEGQAMVGATAQPMSSRSGVLQVSSLDESGLRAQFMVDTYLNRAQFTNNSTEEAKSFVWDFGDGTTSTERSPMHIYPTTGGTYNVKLTAKGVVAENVAEQAININAASVWGASGDYTVNPAVVGVRNFVSMQEAVSILSACKVEGNMSFALLANSVHELNLSNPVLLQQFLKIAADLKKSGCRMDFVVPEGSKATFAITLPADPMMVQSVVEWCKYLDNKSINVLLNQVKVDFSILNMSAEQTVCTDVATQPVAFSKVSADKRLTAEWEAVVKQGSLLAGYAQQGKGDLPAMSINHSGDVLEGVTYKVTYKLDGQVIYVYHYLINVIPSIENSNLTYYSPSDKAELSALSQTLDWNDVKGAIGYRLEVKRLEYGAVKEDFLTVELEKNQSRYTVNNLTGGAEYSWQVFALGKCDEKAGAIRTFTLKKRSDLVVEHVQTVDMAKGLSVIQVKAQVVNRGEGTTNSSSWNDAIYASAKANDFHNATYLKTITHHGALAAGDSYSVTFEVKTPDMAQGQVYYYIKSDKDNYETIESDETNNVGVSNLVTLVENLITDQDYSALKSFYNATNGEAWKRSWNITSQQIAEGRWPGVVFDNDGNVTEINLTDNRLVGALPASGFVLPKLTKLVLHGNQLTGDVALFVKGCPELSTLDLSDNLLTDMSEPLSSNIKTLDLSAQHASGGREQLEIQNWQMGKAMKNVALTQVQSYSHSAQDFLSCPDLNLYARSNNAYIGSLVYVDNAYSMQLDGEYKEKNGEGVLVRVANGVAANSCLRATLSFISGDSNVDGMVSVLDAQQTLNRVLARNKGNFNYVAANTWLDGVINVQDIVTTINLFVDHEPVQKTAPMGDKPEMEVVGYLNTAAGKVVLSTTRPVAALDFLLEGVKSAQVALRLAQDKFQMVTKDVADGVRVVIFSPAGAEIPAGETTILACSGRAEVTCVEGADVEAQPMALAAGEATGIGEAFSAEMQLKVSNHQLIIEGVSECSELVVMLYDASGKKVVQEVCNATGGRAVVALPANFVGAGVVEVSAAGFTPIAQKVFIK